MMSTFYPSIYACYHIADRQYYIPYYQPGELNEIYFQLSLQREMKNLKNIHLMFKIICLLSIIAITTVKLTYAHAYLMQGILAGGIFVSGVGMIWTLVKQKNLEDRPDPREDMSITEECE